MEETYPANIKVERSCCPLGCNVGDEFILKGRDRLHSLPGEFSVVRCRLCGLMRTDPRPTQDTIGFYYPEEYGPYHGTKVINAHGQFSGNTLWKRITRRVFQFNTNNLPHINPGRMLEIGCASGAFMYYMAQKGWEVEGIELSQRASENARALGYEVHTGSVETASAPRSPYDLIVGWMVLEHLHDPVLALEKLYSWTKPGGWFVFSVPNAASLQLRIFKNAWYALQLPNHLYQYTPKTLQVILKKTGWITDKIYYQRVLSDLFASVGYVLSDKGYKKNITRWLIEFPQKSGKLHYILYPASFILGSIGQTGRMTIWARKING